MQTTSRMHHSNHPQSVAVYPFMSFGAQQEDEFLSHGISELISEALSKLQGLHVIAPHSAFKYALSEEDQKYPGYVLHTAFILEGSLRRRNGKITITLSLTETEQNIKLWTDSYEQEEHALFALINHILLQVAERLREHAGHFHIPQTLFSPPTRNIKAFEYYLLGKLRVRKATAEGFSTGIDYFEAAVEEDSSFQLAQAEAGLACVDAASKRILEYNSTIKRANAFNQACLQYPTPIVESHLLQAKIALHVERNFEKTFHTVHECLQLNPGKLEAYITRAKCCMVLGYHDSALESLQVAANHDPINPEVLYMVAYVHYLKGAYHSCILQCDEALHADSACYGAMELKIAALIHQGYEHELDSFLKYLPGNLNRFRLLFRLVHDKTTQASEIEKWLQMKSDDNSLSTHMDWSLYVNIYAGNIQFAIGKAEVELMTKAPASLYFLHDPFLKPLRATTAFKVILERYLKPTGLQPLELEELQVDTPAKEHAGELIERISKVMEGEMLYLNQKLTLPLLAEALMITSNTLSYILSENMKVSFNHWISAKRLNHFEEQMRKSPEQSILTTAFESGFSSKHEFQQNFMHKYGMMPEAWVTSVLTSKTED